MLEFKSVRSTKSEIPLLEIGEHYVYVRTNVTAIQENVGTDNEFVGWQYDEIQYEKDEYIKQMSDRNATNEATLDTLLTEIIPSITAV